MLYLETPTANTYWHQFTKFNILIAMLGNDTTPATKNHDTGIVSYLRIDTLAPRPHTIVTYLGSQ